MKHACNVDLGVVNKILQDSVMGDCEIWVDPGRLYESLCVPLPLPQCIPLLKPTMGTLENLRRSSAGL